MKRGIYGALLALGILAGAGPAAAINTGCGVGAHGALLEGRAEEGPLHIGVGGQSVGGSIFCNYRMGSMVIGAFGEMDKVFGDLESLVGIDTTISAGARVGIMPTNNALVYTGVQHTWIRGSGDAVTAWGVMGGLEVGIADTPLSVDLRYTHLFVEDVFNDPDVTVSGSSVRLGLNWSFYKPPSVAARPLK
jgi:opacity protein-like surface antigen